MNENAGPGNGLKMHQEAADIKVENKHFNNEEPHDCLKCTRTGICYVGCIDALGIDPFQIGEPTGRIIKALKIAMDYGTAQESERKAFAMDHMVRALLGDQYDKFVKAAGAWDKGVG